MQITILTETELRQCVQLDQAALDAVADAFTRLANGQAMMPPIMRVEVPENNGEVDIKSAYLQGLHSFSTMHCRPGCYLRLERTRKRKTPRG